MRLKSLFFPIMMVISVAIFWGFAWPEIMSVKAINEERMVILKNLQDAKNKQITIDQAKNKIVDDSAGTSIINEYLPSVKVEERIIDSMNYAAGNANVALTNMSVGDTQSKMLLSNAIDPATGLPLPAKPDLIMKTVATVSISGEYDKIKMFLNNIQKIPIYNNINSVAISKKKSADDGKELTANDSTLLAEISIDFGRMDQVKVTNQKFEEKIDTNTALILKKYIMQKTQSLDVNNGDRGKLNPFLAN